MTVEEAFRAAVTAVENDDYEAFEAILTQQPDVLDYVDDFGNSLFDEFTALFRTDFDDDVTPGVDERAIGILLDRGANPGLSPNAIGSILSDANKFIGAPEDYPINSGVCLARRDSLVPLVNRMMRSGAKFSQSIQYHERVISTLAYQYAFELCFTPFVCGNADYETVPEDIAERVEISMTLVERHFLIAAMDAGTVNEVCLSHLLSLDEGRF